MRAAHIANRVALVAVKTGAIKLVEPRAITGRDGRVCSGAPGIQGFALRQGPRPKAAHRKGCARFHRVIINHGAIAVRGHPRAPPAAVNIGR